MDFTWIEIKKEDNIKTHFFLDDNILKSNYSNKDYLNHSVTVYGLNTKDNYKLYYSNGYIKAQENYLFGHTCNTYPGCSGGCIVIENTNCVIGIHKGHDKNKVNVGIFINDVIKDIAELVNHCSYNLYRLLIINDIILLLVVNHCYIYYFIIENKSLLFLLFYY